MLSFPKLTDISGWQNLKWGDDINRVRDLYWPEIRLPTVNEQHRFPDDASRDMEYVWTNYKFTELAFSNVDFDVYFFSDQRDRLCRVALLTNPNNYIFGSDFLHVEKMLKKKYGTPLRSDDTSFENCLYYRRIWSFPSTIVELIYFYDKHAALFVGQPRQNLSTSGIFKTNIQILYYKNEKSEAKKSKTVQDALKRAEKAGKLTEGRFLYEVTLSDESVYFGFDKSSLSHKTKQTLDMFVRRLREEGKDIYMEIQGHTDNVGSNEYNYRLGVKRAKSVMQYLRTRYDIPLHRMNLISYGESMPIVDNGSPENRSQNRRVAIVVME